VARIYAEAAGRSLGKLVSLTEGGGRVVGRRMARSAELSVASGMEPGTQKVGVDVTAEWDLSSRQ
jgi:uncharacterized protein YggE